MRKDCFDILARSSDMGEGGWLVRIVVEDEEDEIGCFSVRRSLQKRDGQSNLPILLNSGVVRLE
jgi:hypothetical protein